jgi:cellulose biosynthesis protein BcsQ
MSIAARLSIIGVSNIKGGVGKTTTTVTLAFLAASAGRRTVLWDLDPQGASTYLLGGESDERASARKLVRGRRELREILAPTRFENLTLLPAFAPRSPAAEVYAALWKEIEARLRP